MKTVLVDDDDISVFLTKTLLEDEGLAEGLRTFTSSVDALHYMQQAIPNALPSIILLDLNMPVLSGWDFLAALQPYAAQLTGRCFIYLLTSSLALSDAARAANAVLVTELIHKPLDEMQLRQIQTYVSEHQR